MVLLGDSEIEERLKGSEWRQSGDAIAREFKLADFVAAVEFIDRVAAIAEELGHHPDILLHGWNKVRFTLSTHSAGGLTQSDFDLAARIDTVA